MNTSNDYPGDRPELGAALHEDVVAPLTGTDRVRERVAQACEREPADDRTDHERRLAAVGITIAGASAYTPERTAADGSREASSPRWITPLDAFLGDEEPNDDDSADWIIRDVIPRGEAALIAGPPKCGKTWAMLGLAIDVALGRPWLDVFENTVGEPARVLVLAFEDSQRRLGKRLWELTRGRGISPLDPTLRANLSLSRTPLALPGDEAAFAAELKRWRPTLVLIDNLTRVMVGDQNAIKDAKRFADTWCRLCGDVGAAVVFLHHTSKVGPVGADKRGLGDPFEAIRGSGDLVASARHLVLTRPIETSGDDKLADVRMRGNLDLRREDFVLSFERSLDPQSARWVARLTDRGDGDAVRGQLAAERRATKEATQRTERAAERERRRRVAMEIAQRDGRCSTRTLAEALGLTPNAAKPTLDELVESGDLEPGATKREAYVIPRASAEQGGIDFGGRVAALHQGGS